MKQSIFDPPTKEQLFDDEDYWEVGVLVSTIDSFRVPIRYRNNRESHCNFSFSQTSTRIYIYIWRYLI